MMCAMCTVGNYFAAQHQHDKANNLHNICTGNCECTHENPLDTGE